MSAQRLRDAAAHVRLTTDQYPPGVGIALADWLDDEAGRIDMATEAGGDARPYEPAARLADLILGGGPDA